jgi:hypothetical protein
VTQPKEGRFNENKNLQKGIEAVLSFIGSILEQYCWKKKLGLN